MKKRDQEEVDGVVEEAIQMTENVSYLSKKVMLATRAGRR